MIKSATLIFAISCNLFIACTPRITTFKHTMPTMPLLSEEKQIDIASGFSSNHLEAQLAYSPVKNILVTSSAFLSIANKADHKGFNFNPYYNVGLGYYHQLGNDFSAEFIGEIGSGNIHYDYDKSKNFKDTEKLKWRNKYVANSAYYTRSLIVNLGWKLDKNFIMGLGAKLNSTKYLYNNFVHTFEDNDPYSSHGSLANTENSSYEMQTKTRLYLSPAFIVKMNFGGKISQRLALFLSISEQFELTNSDLDIPYKYYTPLLISSGLSYRFLSSK